MEEGEAWDAVEKRDDSGACIEAFVVRPPGRQGATGDLKDLRRVTLREALSLQIAIPLKQTRAFDAIPALVAIIVAAVRILDDCAHSDLLCPPFALVHMSTCCKGWRGRLVVSRLRDGESRLVWSPQRHQVADAMIKARRKTTQYREDSPMESQSKE